MKPTMPRFVLAMVVIASCKQKVLFIFFMDCPDDSDISQYVYRANKEIEVLSQNLRNFDGKQKIEKFFFEFNAEIVQIKNVAKSHILILSRPSITYFSSAVIPHKSVPLSESILAGQHL